MQEGGAPGIGTWLLSFPGPPRAQLVVCMVVLKEFGVGERPAVEMGGEVAPR
jgi:hypothetical protein